MYLLKHSTVPRQTTNNPLSVTASITAALTLAMQVIQRLDDVKHVSKAREAIRDEIDPVRTVLLQLKDLSEPGNSPEKSHLTVASLGIPDGLLDRIQ